MKGRKRTMTGLRALHYLVRVLTLIAVIVAWYEAGFGGDFGFMVMSLTVGILGIFVVALTWDVDRGVERRSDND